MLNLFQTVSGAWHIPSLLTVAGWVVSGILIFIGLRVNRDDRVKAFLKEQESHGKIIELEARTRPKPLDQRLREFLAGTIGNFDPRILDGLANSPHNFVLVLAELTFVEDSELRRLAAEDGASHFIAILPPENEDSALEVKDTGITVKQVRFRLYKALLPSK